MKIGMGVPQGRGNRLLNFLCRNINRQNSHYTERNRAFFGPLSSVYDSNDKSINIFNSSTRNVKNQALDLFKAPVPYFEKRCLISELH